jgi:hypothetical protein
MNNDDVNRFPATDTSVGHSRLPPNRLSEPTKKRRSKLVWIAWLLLFALVMLFTLECAFNGAAAPRRDVRPVPPPALQAPMTKGDKDDFDDEVPVGRTAP